MCNFNKLFSLNIFIILISFISCSTLFNKTTLTPPLLLILSFDGFRWDYPDIYQLTTFNSIIQRGVHVNYIENSFVTATFPSHFTMATGFYEETHGIVGNIMYDPQLNATAAYSTLNDTKWWSQNSQTQPIWISNQLANDSLQRKSGVISWPGSSVPINGHLPSRYLLFNETRTCRSSIQQMLDWFREPVETRINFGAIYCSEPDRTGHAHGPISNEMNQTLHGCDDDLREFLRIIDDDVYLKANLNVIVTADHGMHEIKENHTIKLINYIDSSLYKLYGTRTYMNMFIPSAENIDRIYKNLSTIPNLQVYKKSQIPEKYHYKSNVRIGDIFLVSKLGWEIIAPDDDGSHKFFGNHGHDNQEKSMHPIFYAFGPAFQTNFSGEPFHSVDYYPLMSYILQLKPRQTNGSLDNVKSILKDFSNQNLLDRIHTLLNKTTTKVSSWGYLTIGCLILVLLTALLFTTVACRHSRQLIYVQSEYPPIRYHSFQKMLDDIIEKTTSSTDKDKQELPTRLPSSHAKYVTRQTTFGRVRVDLPSKSEQRQFIESLYKQYNPTSEENQKFDTQVWSLVDNDIDSNEHDIDFYGLINAHYRNLKFEENLSAPKEDTTEDTTDNYIDQLAFPELTTKKSSKIKQQSLQQETIEQLKTEELNPIDEQYFGTLKEIKYENKQNTKSISTKRIEMPSADELNYIDQLVFSPSETITSKQDVIPPKQTKPTDSSSTTTTTTSSDKLLDINFQFRIATPIPQKSTKSTSDLNESPMDSYNPKLETMRSIKPKDYFDPPRQSALDIQKNIEIDSSKNANEPAERIREQLTKKTSDRDSLGYRTFENLVPHWWKMTKAEIVDILMKQICFIQRGPGVQISIAHVIPQIIERLNRPDVKQLHLLHRLDKQSTGVLLMAYTPDAEKRLRELMLEHKITKQYLAIVRGKPHPSEGEIKIPIMERNVRGTYKMMLSPEYNDLTKLVLPKTKRSHINSSNAITKYRVLDSNYGVSLVECQPITGVKHQIRTHLAHALGTPLLGDHKYSHYAKLAPQKLQFATLKKLGVRQAKVRTVPLCLHSYSIVIPNFLHHQQNLFIRARLSHHLRYFIQCFRLRMIR
ncbi:hypothetical protein I4U23_002406 [Adineta vaga]|nr:hypothetical protein I4U23_002406 [Adineta vaga]